MKSTCLFVALFLPAMLSASPLTRSAVLILNGSEPVGSGVIVSHKGRVVILTCAHVASDFAECDDKGNVTYTPVTIRTRSGSLFTTRKGKVTHVSAGERPDLAVIEPDDARAMDPVPLLPESESLEVGETVWYCGYGNGVPWNLVKSIVNDDDDNGKLRVNGEGWFGHSGSGILVRRKGKLYLSGVLFALRGNRDETLVKKPLLCEKHGAIHKYLKGVK